MRADLYRMIQRRAHKSKLETRTGCHTWRTPSWGSSRSPSRPSTFDLLKGIVTLAMHNTFNVLLARAVEQGREQELYSLRVSQLGSDLETDSKNTEFLKETVRRL